jgi:O-antigen/teichoic acid export membrane protein
MPKAAIPVQISSTSVKNFYSLIKERLTPLIYAASAVATAVAQLVAGLAVIKWVAPEELGLWQSVRLAQVYAFILLAGINNGLSRELPYYLGKGERPFSEGLLATTLFCTTLANAFVLVIGAGCAIAFASRGAHLVYAILAVTVLVVASFYHNVFLVTFRSKDSFNKLTIVQLVEAGLSLATLPMVYFYHYEGMLGRTVLISIVLLWLMYVFLPMKVPMRLDRNALKLLLKTGLPIFGLDYLKNFANTLDRVVLLHVGGVKDVGYYSLASMALGTLQVLPQSLSSYVYPRMTYKLGQNGDARALWGFGLKFVLLAMALTGLGVVCGWLALPHFVPAFAPKYMGGLHAAEIILVAGIWEGSLIITSALWSMKAWKLMSTYQVLSSILCGLGPVVGVIVVGHSLEGVAWGVVVGYFCRGFLGLALTYYGTHTAVYRS